MTEWNKDLEAAPENQMLWLSLDEEMVTIGSKICEGEYWDSLNDNNPVFPKTWKEVNVPEPCKEGEI